MTDDATGDETDHNDTDDDSNDHYNTYAIITLHLAAYVITVMDVTITETQCKAVFFSTVSSVKVPS